ncbi:MAG: hypothetical protein QM490_05440 [Candidatus Gracilibacteria bacterium]
MINISQIEEYGEKHGTTNFSKKISKMIKENNIYVDKLIEEGDFIKKENIGDEEVKDDETSNVIGEVLENGNINITKEVREKFINFGETMGFTSNSPISLILKAIGENYLDEHETAPMGFLMIQEYVKYDIDKGSYGGGKNRGKQIESNLAELTDDIKAFTVIYPKILGEMFGKDFGEGIKNQLIGMGMNISEESEEGILSYYNELDINNKIMEVSELNIGAVSSLMALKGISTQDELNKYIEYIKENNLSGVKLWRLFAHELGEDPVKLKEYFDERIV